MSEQENAGLTLEGLAQRLEALERENTALRHKVVTLEDSGTRRDELAENRGSDTRRSEEAPASAFDEQVSRRSLLSKAGAAAVAAAAAGMLLNPREAKADHYGPGIEVDFVRVHRSHAYGVSSIVDRGGFGVYGQVNNSVADYEWAGVGGVGDIGVRGGGRHIGVKGTGKNGVHGQSEAPRWAGVYGNNTTTDGYGVVGDGQGKGAGVLGRGRAGAPGGVFNADKGGAQVWLQPGESRDRPTIGDHARGELYMDAIGTLFVCTDGGNPGVWRVVQTGPA